MRSLRRGDGTGGLSALDEGAERLPSLRRSCDSRDIGVAASVRVNRQCRSSTPRGKAGRLLGSNDLPLLVRCPSSCVLGYRWLDVVLGLRKVVNVPGESVNLLFVSFLGLRCHLF